MVLKSTLAAGLFAIAAAFATVTPAAAGSADVNVKVDVHVGTGGHAPGWHGDRGDHHARLLSPYQVRMRLRRHGYNHIDFFDTRGHVYSATAFSPRHGRVVVKVSARSGHVVSWERFRRHHRSS